MTKLGPVVLFMALISANLSKATECFLTPEANRLTVTKFFANYNLPPAEFVQKQSALFSEQAVIVVEDYRGTLTYKGSQGYMASLSDWSALYETRSDFRMEPVVTTETESVVRLRGTLVKKGPKPQNIADNEHNWTEIFTFGPDGKIVRLEVRMGIRFPERLRARQ